MANKYYVVKKGKVPGIYLTWEACKKMVDGYSGAVYKSFKTQEEAEAFLAFLQTEEAGEIFEEYGFTPYKEAEETETETETETTGASEEVSE